MNIRIAAERTLKKAKLANITWEGTEGHGNDPEHIIWMLEQIIEGSMDREKANRWLGWAQGILADKEVLTLLECKHINHIS
jgi:hypothetical protein